jgi:phosphoribosylaminoimidazolecarboxamide formyltransferase/IMP cyclohydrolase
MKPDNYKIKTALLSVSDKTGIVEFAQKLAELGITIYSTGGTATTLAANNVDVHSITELTQFPEILDGRVKTLHPVVHSGLLAELDKEEHRKTLEKHNIDSIDLLVVNLYPFESVLGKYDFNKLTEIDSELIENIDIGGPTMLRSAAKNYRWSAVVVNPKHYETILDYLGKDGCIPEIFRQQMAGEVFNHTAHYDAIIANYFNKINAIEFPETLTLTFNKAQDCRYGENPHQKAAVYGSFLSQFEQLHGKELSYNNVMDINATCELMLEFDKPTVAIVKHTNPCGVASADDFLDAYRLAFATDKESPFGGIVCLNGVLDEKFAEEIHPIFTEVLIATDFTDAALAILTKKRDRRLIKADFAAIHKSMGRYFRSLPNGMLYQEQDLALYDKSHELKVVTNRQPTPEEMENLLFAWKVCKHVKSNAIVYGGRNRTLGIGAGQMSRVDSSKIAVSKAEYAELNLQGSVMASDAFLPFADALLAGVNAGATAIIQPGGSVRDTEVIDAANANNIAMVFTGMRHFKH